MTVKRPSAFESINAVIVMFSVVLIFSARAFSAPPSNTCTVYEEALSAYSGGNYMKAQQLLENEVKKRPSAQSYYLLGYASYKLGHRKAAKRYFSEAYLIDPGLNPENIVKQQEQKQKLHQAGKAGKTGRCGKTGE